MEIIIINLPRRKDRYNAMVRKITEITSGNIMPYAFTAAFDGRDLPNFPKTMDTANKFACLLSHISAFEYAFDKNDVIVILEDDVIFATDFVFKLNIFLKYIPEDWDLAYLGIYSMNPIIEPVVTVNITATRPDDKIAIIDEKYKISKLISGCTGAFAYVINGKKPHRFKELMEVLNKHENYIDNTLTDFHKKLNVYALIPTICAVEPGYSDISERVVDHIPTKHLFKM
jgi:GR25 family glycosyltransferase involved in LPS biosynthesis